MFDYNGLKSKLKGRIAFIGVGNTLKGDDGAGILAVNLLEKRFKGKAAFLDCGMSPENYLEKIKEFDTVVIFDAVEFGAKFGGISAFDLSRLTEAGLSTHNLSLKLLFRYFEKDNLSIILIGIQPKNLNFGEGLSKEVKGSVEKFIQDFPAFN